MRNISSSSKTRKFNLRCYLQRKITLRKLLFKPKFSGTHWLTLPMWSYFRLVFNYLETFESKIYSKCWSLWLSKSSFGRKMSNLKSKPKWTFLLTQWNSRASLFKNRLHYSINLGNYYSELLKVVPYFEQNNTF